MIPMKVYIITIVYPYEGIMIKDVVYQDETEAQKYVDDWNEKYRNDWQYAKYITRNLIGDG